jgi:hypothetical protein
MPYIKEERRTSLYHCIDDMINCIKHNIDAEGKELTNDQLLEICGDINYSFSRIAAGLMGKVSYPKIAIITGVLENIKQEFYRRVASQYEDSKIVSNGDIKEYKYI